MNDLGIDDYDIGTKFSVSQLNIDGTRAAAKSVVTIQKIGNADGSVDEEDDDEDEEAVKGQFHINFLKSLVRFGFCSAFDHINSDNSSNLEWTLHGAKIHHLAVHLPRSAFFRRLSNESFGARFFLTILNLKQTFQNTSRENYLVQLNLI